MSNSLGRGKRTAVSGNTTWRRNSILPWNIPIFCLPEFSCLKGIKTSICITWAVLSLACHQYFSKEGGNFISKNPAAILNEELYRLEICNKAMREKCQIFYYSAQGKLTIQMRNRSTLSSLGAARSFSLSLLGPDKLSWYTSLDTSFPFYSVLFWGRHNQRSSWWERHFADTQSVPLWPLSPSSRQIMRMDWWMLLEPW